MGDRIHFSKEEFRNLKELDFKYLEKFDKCIVGIDWGTGELVMPEEWTTDIFAEKIKYCLEHNVKIDTFPEWQKMERENEEWRRQNPDVII